MTGKGAERPTRDDAEHILAALRLGGVPARGHAHYAASGEREFGVLRDQLRAAAAGHSPFKVIRGGYGSGKTFITARLAEAARRAGFAVSTVPLSRDGASLHLQERLYRGVMQHLSVSGTAGNALDTLLSRWVQGAEEYVREFGGHAERDAEGDGNAYRAAVERRLEARLAEVVRERPSFAAALLHFARAELTGEYPLRRSALGWLAGDPHAPARTLSGVRGQVEGEDAPAYLREFTRMLREQGRPGLLIVLDELDEMRHLRRDLRLRAWANLRGLLDMQARGVPGLYLVLAGTPEVLDDRRGLSELPPLHQRLADPSQLGPHPDLRGPQLPLPPLDEPRLREVLRRVEALWVLERGAPSPLPPDFAGRLARGWSEQLGPRSPRAALREFLRVLDRAHDYPDYRPQDDYAAVMAAVTEAGTAAGTEAADPPGPLDPDETF